MEEKLLATSSEADAAKDDYILHPTSYTAEDDPACNVVKPEDLYSYCIEVGGSHIIHLTGPVINI